ncbi:MAG: hypothetical protein J0I20_11510 [Chloroflexi bacterium]|nr:hypothetical protein [Chloroflexota bacterium]OJV92365.1 MAG: hypothetical protein BGO39_31030 [Chloroflexi bacterium 54-19]
MKLLHLANDFELPEIQTLTISPKVIVNVPPTYLQEIPRRKAIVALLILLIFASFSLTIPLHPTRSAVPNGCSTAIALPNGESAANCIMQATSPSKPTRKFAALPETPASYLVNSQAVSVQLARVIFVRVVGYSLLNGPVTTISEL